MDPGVEPIEVAQSTNVAPSEDERVLNGILGAARVAQNYVGDAIEATDPGRSQRRKGLVIALSRQSHQISLHAFRPFRRDRRGHALIR